MQRRNRLFHAPGWKTPLLFNAPGWKTPLLQRSRLRITADQCIKLGNTVSCLSLPCALEINISIVHDCSQCFSVFLCLGCSVPVFFDFLHFLCLDCNIKVGYNACQRCVAHIFAPCVFLTFSEFMSKLRCSYFCSM